MRERVMAKSRNLVRMELKSTCFLTDEMEYLLRQRGSIVNRGKHWMADAGYHETWGSFLIIVK